MDIISLLQYTFIKVIETFSHNWYLLLISILISAALNFYVDQDAIARFLRRNTKNSVLMSTGVAVATPFCSCGTTAVVLGMMASTIPWAPIVAFMVASPLTSPQELVLQRRFVRLELRHRILCRVHPAWAGRWSHCQFC